MSISVAMGSKEIVWYSAMTIFHSETWVQRNLLNKQTIRDTKKRMFGLKEQECINVNCLYCIRVMQTG